MGAKNTQKIKNPDFYQSRVGGGDFFVRRGTEMFSLAACGPDSYGVGIVSDLAVVSPESGVGFDKKGNGDPKDCAFTVTLLPDGRSLYAGYATKDDKAH